MTHMHRWPLGQVWWQSFCPTGKQVIEAYSFRQNSPGTRGKHFVFEVRPTLGVES